jgi:catechol 2,3-dioxygenase-like lactoylglutathione lyase family enzyme
LIFNAPGACRQTTATRYKLEGGPVRDVFRGAIDGVAIPTLPMSELRETQSFYERLGFHTAYWQMDPDQYLILRRDELEVHFFGLPGLDPMENFAGCYLRVGDVEGINDEFRESGLEGLAYVEEKPWGMREFHLTDPNGNLLRVGQPTYQQGSKP